MNIINYLDERWVVELCANIQDNSKELECFLELAEAVKKSCGRSSLSLTSNIWIAKCGHDNLCDILYGPLNQDADLRDYLLRLARIIDEADSYEIEQPETQEAVKERTKKINEEALFFELHTKLSREKGRIHFHIGSSLSEKINNLTGGRLIVGIVCKHLST